MQIVLNEKNLHTILKKSSEILTRGGMIVYPSDTVYGIAVDGTNQQAVQELADFKGRRSDQKFSYNFSDIEMIKKYHSLSERQEEILRKYLPGPFTFIIIENLSVRIPRDNVVTEIVKYFGKPTTATSANMTGKPTVSSIKALDAKIYLKADLIIEDVDFQEHKPSTVVDISKEKFIVLREGELPFP
ncbi:MAG: L-threonylcarbamoyladenylate synthase [Candidatus Berkelbacteria bacterium]|nr:L-threonylcarbamoyladenylate synthase [Candidatus Berkelbacteria bacterium]